MKFRHFLSLLVAGGLSLSAAAQSQGYIDGIDYYKVGQYSNAKEILSKTLNDAQTDKAKAYYYLGQIALAQKDNTTAKECFDNGIAANPDCAYNYVGLGALALRNGDKKAAEDNFKQALKLGKKNHEITVDIARAYYKADPVAYASDVRKYLDKANKESKFSEPSIFILEGDMLVDQQKFGEAAAQYEQAITADPENPEGYVNYAHSYFGVNPEFSIQKLQEFLQKQPNSALGQRELAEKYYDANYWDKAAEQYGQYIKNPNHFPQDEARYSVLLYFGKKYPESLAVADRLLASQPDNFMMQRLRMLDYSGMEQWADAVKAGEQFFAKNPNGDFNANDYAKYAEALNKNGQDSIATVVLTDAVKKLPNEASLWDQYSIALTAAKNYPEAADAYAKYLSLTENPSVGDYFTAAGYYLNVASGYQKEGKTEEAKTAADKGLEFMNKVVATAEPVPVLYQRIAHLNRMGNNDVVNEATMAAYDKMLELLNADESNLQKPASLNMYRECYYTLNKYYRELKDMEKATEMADLYRKYTEILEQLNQ
ncbi:MAG: tetratricopeptide repeat protein [Muribaculaceae bacterium]|nr:tetratricopeptide repeat protein [Muribaculaceae bacterium]